VDEMTGPSGAAEPPPYIPDPPAEPPTAPAFVTGAVYGALIVLGLLLGLIGSFEFSWTASGVPVAAIAEALVYLAVFRAAGWATGSRLGIAATAVPWLVVTVLMSTRRPEGDLVVTGTLAGYVYIFGGAIAAVVAVASTRPRGPWNPDRPMDAVSGGSR
jgi:hypothetical protein